MHFCYCETTMVPIDETTVDLIERARFYGEPRIFQHKLAARLQLELKENGNQSLLAIYPEDVEELIKRCGAGGDSRSDYSTTGCIMRHLFDTIQKITIVDLRMVTWDQVLTMGYVPSYQWRDKHDPNAEPWPTLKLRMGCKVILWDGREKEIPWGYYIVQTSKGLGTVAYWAHETSYDVEAVSILADVKAS